MDMPGNRSPQFDLPKLAKSGSRRQQKIFKTAGPSSSFHPRARAPGGRDRQHALAGDKVLMVETGHFATLWQQMAARWGIAVGFHARRLAPRR